MTPTTSTSASMPGTPNGNGQPWHRQRVCAGCVSRKTKHNILCFMNSVAGVGSVYSGETTFVSLSGKVLLQLIPGRTSSWGTLIAPSA